MSNTAACRRGRSAPRPRRRGRRAPPTTSSTPLPRYNLVVSQGGAGILFGAVAHGLPQLGLPQGADQFVNGAAAQRAGIALVLDGAEVTPSAITGAADRLLSDPRYAAAARAVRKEIDTMPRADDVVASLTAGVRGFGRP